MNNGVVLLGVLVVDKIGVGVVVGMVVGMVVDGVVGMVVVGWWVWRLMLLVMPIWQW